ncbi:ketopantoate reductase family protein [Marinactinospora endophytica]
MTVIENSQHFAVLGPGGVGGLLAGLLAHAGHRVTVVAQEQTASRLASAGLRVRSRLFGDFTTPIRAVPVLEERPDVLVVAPKATALDAALDRVPATLVHDALVVPLLNGIEHVTSLRTRWSAAHVVAASIRVESTRVAPGEISQTSPFAAMELARSGVPAARVEGLAALLADLGLDVGIGDDEGVTLWSKFHFLLPTALVCTHAGQPIGEVRGARRSDLAAVAREVAAVAERHGIRLDTDGVLGMMDAVPAATKPSMLRDREAGRPMELDALGGALLRAARQVGVETPVTARIVAELERVGPA